MKRPLAKASHIRPPRRTDIWARMSRILLLIGFGAALAQDFVRLLRQALPESYTSVRLIAAPAPTYPIRVRETDWASLIGPPEAVQAMSPPEAAPVKPAAVQATSPVAPRPPEPTPTPTPKVVRPVPPKRVRPKPIPPRIRATLPNQPESTQENSFQLPRSLLPID